MSFVLYISFESNDRLHEGALLKVISFVGCIPTLADVEWYLYKDKNSYLSKHYQLMSIRGEAPQKAPPTCESVKDQCLAFSSSLHLS